ncbi:MAG: GGDEF domain-containing protein [Lapillicoccus sp.]
MRQVRSTLGDEPDLVTPDSASDRFWRFAMVLVTLALVSHCGFLLLFLSFGLWSLSAVNVVSIGLYVLARARARQQRYSSLLIMVVEFFGHALAAGWTLGWSSGFQYYLLLAIPIYLMSERSTRQKLFLSATVALGYTGLSVWLEGAAPHSQVPSDILLVLRLANIAAFCGFLSYICLTYVQLVRDAETRLRVLAERDVLTGLHNRASLAQRAELASRSPGRGTWLVFGDLDHFKSVNDQFGHLRGDATIQCVADEMRRVVRRGDCAARWGGEEFLLLLTDADQQTALSVAERVRSSVAARSRSDPRGSCAVTVTFGVTELRQGEDLDMALTRADAALYEGKRNGRDRVELSV